MRPVVYLSFKRTTFDEIKAAAQQTQLPISSYLQEVIEADLASRRLTEPPLPNSPTLQARAPSG